MMRWFQDNPVGIGLASFCGVLLLLVALLTVVWSLPPSTPGLDDEQSDTVTMLELPELRHAGQLEDYAEIITRPVFNESRQPVIDPDDEEEETEDEELLENVDAPEVELAGVIITPTLRMATLREKGQETSLVAFVGRPLEGPYGTWQITKIEPREVTLASSEGEELQLKLQVHNAKIAAPPKNPDPAEETAEEGGEPSDAVAEDGGDQPLSRAEEIRQRIAERREELRRAAEAEENSNSEVSYQQAIQNMMGKRRQDRSTDEQEE
jgi:hypothetical protein